MAANKTATTPTDQMFLHLARSATRGNRAKRRLARALARLPNNKLWRLSPAIFAQLGAVGYAEFARRSKSMIDRADIQSPRAPKAPNLENSLSLRARWHFAHPFVKVAIAILLSSVIGVAFSNAVKNLRPPGLKSSAGHLGTWPLCTTLDRWTDGCAYVVPRDGITLTMLAAPLDIPAYHLALNNNFAPELPMRQGSAVVILRVSLFGKKEAGYELSNF